MRRAMLKSGAFLALAVAAMADGGCGANDGSESVGTAEADLGSTSFVISQVYGGGGNSGATYKNDFVEIFNRGASSDSVANWSIQYASSTGSSWSVTNLSGTILPGHYYLVQEAAGSGGTTSLPTPDATGTISMSATSAKVALVNTRTALTCGTSCVPNASVIDFVGYGSSASSFEGKRVPTRDALQYDRSAPGRRRLHGYGQQRVGLHCGCAVSAKLRDDGRVDADARWTPERPTDSGVDSADGRQREGRQSTAGRSDAGVPDSGSGVPTLPSPTLSPIAMSTLTFGAFGDIRPANPNDTARYPDGIVSRDLRRSSDAGHRPGRRRRRSLLPEHDQQRQLLPRPVRQPLHGRPQRPLHGHPLADDGQPRRLR